MTPPDSTIDADFVLTKANLVTMCPNAGTSVKECGAVDCGVIKNASIAIRQDQIVWLGAAKELRDTVRCETLIDLNGRYVTPGLIDCHSHQIFGGNRADEWQQRIAGSSYEQIAKQGGGIQSTVNATRSASDEELFSAAEKRLRYLIAQGVTTVEIKSGYGLDVETELRMLKVARLLQQTLPIDISRTFLGAHAVPLEFKNRTDDYVDLVCNEMMPAAKPYCDAVDVFCEGIAFDLAQTERVLQTAIDLGLPIKIHAEQLSLMGGAKLAAEMGASSADHLEYLDESGVKAMAKSGTVAVILPGAFYFIGETKKPPIQLLREYGVPMAVATDFNPGSSPAASLLLMMNMSCTLFGLTVEESLCAVTCHAAKALNRVDIGQLASGKQADLAVWDITSLAEIAYGIGHNPCLQVYKGGKLIFDRES